MEDVENFSWLGDGKKANLQYGTDIPQSENVLSYTVW